MKCPFQSGTAREYLCCLALALSVLPATQACGQTQRLDDTGTYAVPPVPNMQWAPQRPHKSPTMVGEFQFHIRLNLSKWKDQRVRIFLVLSRDQESIIDMTWSPGSFFRAGKARSGQRVQIFAGVVPSAVVEDDIHVWLQSEPDWTGQTRQINVVFELEGV